MEKSEYDEIMSFCKSKLKKTPYDGTGCSRYADAYKEAFLSVMSKVHEVQERSKDGQQ